LFILAQNHRGCLLFNSQILLLAALANAISGIHSPRMDSTHITPAQANRLREILGRNLRFVARLSQRMERLGFPADDPLYVATSKAQRALQELHVRAHYCSCTSGVGKVKC